mgnify:CR=1 FL=1|jgi:hypothetical protein
MDLFNDRSRARLDLLQLRLLERLDELPGKDNRLRPWIKPGLMTPGGFHRNRNSDSKQR